MKIVRIARVALATAVLLSLTLVFVVPGAALVRGLGWLPRLQLVPAILAGEGLVLAGLAASVLLCGRLYCAVLCPLGLAQDVSRFVFRLCRLARTGRPPVKAVRYGLLLLFPVAILSGLTGLIEPYGIFGRFLLTGIRRLGEPSVALTVWSLSLVIVILLMTAWRARWWCNQVCPVGTLLGLFARSAFFRVRIDATKCVGCGACVKACGAGALERLTEAKAVTVDASRCISCFACADSCRQGALDVSACAGCRR